MMFTHNPALRRTTVSYGAVAQLIERVVRNDEVRGLIPLCSTILRSRELRMARPTFALATSSCRRPIEPYFNLMLYSLPSLMRHRKRISAQ